MTGAGPPYTPPPMTGPIVDLAGIAVRRPGALVLRDVSLRIAPGEAVGLFGGNGSGKTTLLRVLATLLRPTAGAGTVLGAALGTNQVEAVRPRIGLIAHEPALAERLTLLENLTLFARLGGHPPDAARTALEDVGLAGAVDRPAAACSNGMRRRAEFARILLLSPTLLLLDEAHVGLDPAAGRLVEHVAAEVVGRGGAVVLVSHEHDRAKGIIHRFVTLHDGILEGAA